ncbi:MAG: ABC transporter permease [Actinobacteria bacterium]|nr:MAG: ABC transporter permease [Actinomycetota bacterium]REK38683.1 MAG: ABC transporter permease [Actinomycetota bacterium]
MILGRSESRHQATTLIGRLFATTSGKVGAIVTLIVLLVAIFADVLAPYDPLSPIGPSLSPPTREHLMGTDALGRDLLSGVIHGARTSMVIALSVGAVAMVIGVLVGGISGYAGGRLDDILMRFTEIVQVLPRFFLAILAVAFFGPGLLTLILVLGLTSWVILARVIRAEVLSLRAREFVDSALTQGARGSRVLFREILPNAIPVGIIYLALLLAFIILIEASLGFLGLGDPNAISWGFLAGQAQQFLRVAWWLSVFPGLAITATVLGLNLLGDGLTDALGRR